METIILSATMQAFMTSDTPEYGGKAFTLSTDYGIDFEAATWWAYDEYFGFAVVLTEPRHVVVAMLVMHDYIIEQWHQAVRNLRNETPEHPAREYESDGRTRVISEYYDIDSILGFGYRMGLIVTEPVAKELRRLRLPEDLTVYVVMPDDRVFYLLPSGGMDKPE